MEPAPREIEQSAAALARSLRENELLLSAIPDMLFRVTRDGTYLSYQAPETFRPYRPIDEVVGKNVRDSLPGEVGEAVMALVEEAIASGSPRQMEIRLPAATGDVYRDARFVPAENEEALIIIRDITQEKQVSLAFDRSQRENKLLLEAIPDLLMRLRGDGTFIWARAPRDFRLLMPLEDVVGNVIGNVLPPPLAGEAMENIQRALSSQEAQVFQYTLTFGDEQSHWEARVVPTGEDEVLVIVRDVTQRRLAELQRDEHHAQRLEAERRLSEQQAQLAHVTRLTTLGEMVAVMAHEMTQPLAAISNYAAAATTQLSSLPESDEEVAAWMGKVSQQAARAGKIIQRLRGFVRRGERTLQGVSLDETVADAIGLTDVHLRRLNVTTNFSAHGKPFDVIADRVQIQQVFVNLISNAGEAMSAAADSSRVVEIRLTYDDAQAIITVSDDGPGIAPQHAHRVFEPFYTTKPDGIGIGLSICRGIVESHGGQIWLTTSPTSFHVQLPRNPPPAN